MLNILYMHVDRKIMHLLGGYNDNNIYLKSNIQKSSIE